MEGAALPEQGWHAGPGEPEGGAGEPEGTLGNQRGRWGTKQQAEGEEGLEGDGISHR